MEFIMPDWKLIFGVAAVVACIYQYVSYTIDIVAGKTRPHAFSWFIWGVPAGVVFAAQLVKGGGAGSWATAVTTILCTGVFILSLFYGEKNITRVDWGCLLAALVAIALWAVTKDPVGSVILITMADTLGIVPTVRKSLHKPYEETLNSYLVGGLKWLLSLFALENFTLTVWLYPAVMMCCNWTIVTVLVMRRKKIMRPH